MRINKFIARGTGLSRRAADAAIAEGKVSVNGVPAQTGQDITADDHVSLDGQPIPAAIAVQTILFNKPAGFVVSRNGQGSQTIYDLLPLRLHHLKPVGRLDKDSSGLLILTTDGQLAEQLTHPRHQKTKMYDVELDKSLQAAHETQISQGIALEDGPSQLQLKPLDTASRVWQVTMTEGRNRQIRRTFAALGYTVTKLHRTQFGDFRLPPTLAPGNFQNT